RQRHANRVPNSLREQLFEGQTGLDDPFGRHTRLGDPKVEGDVRPQRGEPAVGFDYLRGIRILQGDHEALKAHLLHQAAVVQGGLNESFELVAGVAFQKLRSHRAAVYSNADRAIGVARHSDQPRNLVAQRFGALDVVQMTWIVADLIDVGSDLGGQPVVFLQIDDERRVGLAANFFERFDFFVVVHGEAHNGGAGALKLPRLGNARVGVARRRGTHALHRHRRAGTDLYLADTHGPGRASGGNAFHDSASRLADGSEALKAGRARRSAARTAPSPKRTSGRGSAMVKLGFA